MWSESQLLGHFACLQYGHISEIKKCFSEYLDPVNLLDEATTTDPVSIWTLYHPFGSLPDPWRLSGSQSTLSKPWLLIWWHCCVSAKLKVTLLPSCEEKLTKLFIEEVIYFKLSSPFWINYHRSQTKTCICRCEIYCSANYFFFLLFVECHHCH